MKLRILSLAAVTAALCVPAVAAERERSSNLNQNQDPAVSAGSARADAASRRGARDQIGRAFQKASALIGSGVVGVSDEDIAQVKDLAVELESGRVLLVILQVGGVAGIGSDYVGVPAQEFRGGGGERKLRLNKSRAQLDQSPKLDLDAWDNSVNTASLSRIYAAHGRDLSEFDVPSMKAGRTGQPLEAASPDRARQGPSFGRIERASQLLDAEIVDANGREIAEVEDLVVDLEDARLVHVVTDPEDSDDVRAMIPPMALRWDSTDEELRFRVDAAKYGQARRFSEREWPEQNADYVIEVYRVFAVEPYFGPGDRQPVRGEVTDKVAPAREDGEKTTVLEQGNNPQDLGLTRDIRRALMDDDGLSTSAKNIRIISTAGQVTLVGEVESQEEKQKVEAVARQFAGESNVISRVEVDKD